MLPTTVHAARTGDGEVRFVLKRVPSFTVTSQLTSLLDRRQPGRPTETTKGVMDEAPLHRGGNGEEEGVEATYSDELDLWVTQH